MAAPGPRRRLPPRDRVVAARRGLARPPAPRRRPPHHPGRRLVRAGAAPDRPDPPRPAHRRQQPRHPTGPGAPDVRGRAGRRRVGRATGRPRSRTRRSSPRPTGSTAGGAGDDPPAVRGAGLRPAALRPRLLPGPPRPVAPPRRPPRRLADRSADHGRGVLSVSGGSPAGAGDPRNRRRAPRARLRRSGRGVVLRRRRPGRARRPARPPLQPRPGPVPAVAAGSACARRRSTAARRSRGRVAGRRWTSSGPHGCTAAGPAPAASPPSWASHGTPSAGAARPRRRDPPAGRPGSPLAPTPGDPRRDPRRQAPSDHRTNATSHQTSIFTNDTASPSRQPSRHTTTTTSTTTSSQSRDQNEGQHTDPNSQSGPMHQRSLGVGRVPCGPAARRRARSTRARSSRSC